MKKITIGLVGLALTFLLSLTLPSQAGPLSELILFAAKPFSHFQLYGVRPDGRDLTRLVNTRTDCREPNLSSTNNEIIFSMQEDKAWHIYKTDVHGSFLQRLTNTQAFDRHPCWSSDGEHIVFETNRWGQSELAVMDKDGNNLQRLTVNSMANRFPVWSPSQSEIAFISWRQGSANLYLTAPLPEAKAQRLTHNKYNEGAPAWSPDGQCLVFESQDHLSHFLSIWEKDGTIWNLKRGCERASYPAWSPDGRQILFSWSHKKDFGLKTVDIENQQVEAFICPPPARAYDLVWQKKHVEW